MKSLLALAAASTFIIAPAAWAQTKPAAPPTTAPDKSKPTATPPAKPAEKSKEGTPPKSDGPSKEMEDAAKAGANHRLLEWFEGEWEALVATPGQDRPDKGTMTCKMVFGGRFLMMEYDGRSRGKFFRGSGMWGYNNLEKRFEQTWADSESTAILFMTGKASADGKSFSLICEAADPTTGKKTFMKSVSTITGKNSWKDEFFSYENNKEVKTMEIVYTRTKAESDNKPAEKEPAAEKPAEKPEK